MESLTLVSSTAGRIAPRPFARGVIIVYALSFLSQVLISPPVTARWGVWAFALVQAPLIWVWFALHAKRLRDAGQPLAPALAIAVLYVLAIVLLMLLVGPIIGAEQGGTDAPRMSFGDLWVFLLLFSALATEPGPNLFYLLSLGLLSLILTPVAIALGFSIWTGTRPAAAPRS